MKILHVIVTLSSRYGGPPKVCREMCRALAQMGQEVTIYTTDIDYPNGRLDVPPNTPLVQDGYAVWYFPVQFYPYVASIDMARALHHNAKAFDLIHIHELYRFPQAVAAHYARRHSIPYIISPRGSLDPFVYYKHGKRLKKRLYEYLIELRNLNNAAAIHFTSEEEMVLAQPLQLAAPAIVVPNGLEPLEYENLPPFGTFRNKYSLQGKEIILFLGRINQKKGLDILVKAFAQVTRVRENARLVLAGPDNEGYSDLVSRWLVQEGVEDRTVFTGMLDGVNKLAALKDADVFTLPSYGENFGVAVTEALACGLPVVISDKVNIWRDVQRGGAGLVTSCHAPEVAKALLSLLANKGLRQRMGKAGKALVRAEYSWDSVVCDLLDSYRTIRNKNITTSTAHHSI